MRLQIHDVPAELMRGMKRRALDEGKHLREWVIDTLGGIVFPSDSDSLVAMLEPRKAAPMSPTDIPVAVMKEAVKEFTKHDPKTCRVYGCLLCKAAKKSTLDTFV